MLNERVDVVSLIAQQRAIHSMEVVLGKVRRLASYKFGRDPLQEFDSPLFSVPTIVAPMEMRLRVREVEANKVATRHCRFESLFVFFVQAIESEFRERLIAAQE